VDGLKNLCKNSRVTEFVNNVCVTQKRPLAVYLRNKSWKPECVLSFNMGIGLADISILSRARSNKANLIAPVKKNKKKKYVINSNQLCNLNLLIFMLKLKTHSGFHDLFRF